MCIHAVWHEHSLFVDIYYSIHWFWKRTMKALISLRLCAGWSGPALSANCIRVLFVACASFVILSGIRIKDKASSEKKRYYLCDPPKEVLQYFVKANMLGVAAVPLWIIIVSFFSFFLMLVKQRNWTQVNNNFRKFFPYSTKYIHSKLQSCKQQFTK